VPADYDNETLFGHLPEVLSRRVVILDGGLATELEAQGADVSSDLWSARLLIDDPAEIRRAHTAFFQAGAEVAITASYQVSYAGLASRGIDRSGADRLLRLSVELAAQARDDAGGGWVAASVGPFGATLADGSEYRGDYGLSVSQLREFHRPRLQALVQAQPDVLAVETIPCLREVEALVAELDRIDVPAWVSLTAAGTRTRAGEELAEAFELLDQAPGVFAVGVNCMAPAGVLAALEVAASRTDKPLLAYPNSGERWDPPARRWAGDSRFDSRDVSGWLAAGARLVGGCCRVLPADIAALGAELGVRP
jgi:homocysteine S-methyltransferase